MHPFRLLLLAFFFLLSTSAEAVASVHQCCPDLQCDIVHCLEMGCAPALPAVAFNQPATPVALRAAELYGDHVTRCQPDLYEEVWTPPD